MGDVVLAYMIYVRRRGFWDRVDDGVLCRTRAVVGFVNNTTISAVYDQGNQYSKLALHG